MIGYRTHTCGELRAANVTEKVILCGWVHSRRDHGNLIFIDLRDRYGITQVVFNSQKNKSAHQLASTLKPEYVVQVKGIVTKRPDGSVNPKLLTGEIEIEASEIEILSTCDPLPFEINSEFLPSEELRLKYRYLDMRRYEVQRAFIMRHKITQIIRNYFDREGFIEVETPYLTKSTPEGARDYLVPSRVSLGQFYALPQSPQLFKQLLMIAGVDKYFQIVRCFRDEDLRADRQPEFTQIDVEISFADENTIMNVIERMFAEVFDKVFNKNLPTPFPRITYAESMKLYGTDKPDLRFGLPLYEVTDIVCRSDFNIFKKVIENYGLIKGLTVSSSREFSRKEIDELTQLTKTYGAEGLISFKVVDNKLSGAVSKYFNENIQMELVKRMNAHNNDLILLLGDKPDVVNAALAALRNYLGKALNLIKADDFCFVWVVDFPLFEYNEKDQQLQSKHHPFTAPKEDEIDFLEKSPLQIKARAYDLVVNGTEIGGGSIRIHNADLQKRIFHLLGLSSQSIQEKFGFFLEAFKYGVPPHGGIALGLDRIVMILLGFDSIREVIAFPKTTRAACLLTGAPSKVDQKQLQELGIKVEEKNVLTQINNGGG